MSVTVFPQPSPVFQVSSVQGLQCSKHSIPNVPSTESTVSPVQGPQHPQHRVTILGLVHGPQGPQCTQYRTLLWSQHAATILGSLDGCHSVLQCSRGSLWQVPLSMACPQCHHGANVEPLSWVTGKKAPWFWDCVSSISSMESPLSPAEGLHGCGIWCPCWLPTQLGQWPQQSVPSISSLVSP